VLSPPTLGRTAQQSGVWLSAWQATFQRTTQPLASIAGRTLIVPVQVSIGGNAARVRLTNELGVEALKIGAAKLTLPDGSLKELTFGGLTSAVIPAGAPMISDAVDAKLAALQTVTLRVYLPDAPPPSVADREPAPVAMLTAAGDFTAVADSKGTPYDNILLSAVEVRSATKHPVVVVFGDTKSAGAGTWPAFLLPRTAARNIALTNPSMWAGLLALGPRDQSGLARFDRDVLTAAGATHVILAVANNDIIQPGTVGSNGKTLIDPFLAMSVPQLIAAYRQLIDRARTHGLKIIGATLLPYEGVALEGYSTPEKLAKRDAVNAWIRSGGAFDGIIDFDALLRDPTHPQRLAPQYDSGNHFTPNAAGFKQMADVVDLQLFR
jgi:lysophospholipase L1-like esterase